MNFTRTILVCLVAGIFPWTYSESNLVRAVESLKMGTFDIDATPPVGSPLAYDIMDRREASLRLKGVVLLGNGPPIVLTAVDWIGIGGEGQTVFRNAIAAAAGTSPDRVAVHCLHQHDAPRFDTSAEALLAEVGLSGAMFNVAWTRQLVQRVAAATRDAVEQAESVTHIGLGQAKIEKVASNRRILGNDGKVQYIRWTATRDPKIRAFPDGVIDPFVKTICFYQRDRLLGVLTYYATHPQSYYRTKTAHPDFPGMARESRQEVLGAPHIHFNGAGGNIGAGKYNDGSHANRSVLAKRVAAGMADAYADVKRSEISADDLGWSAVDVVLPPADHLDAEQLEATLKNPEAKTAERIGAAKALAFLRRCHAGETIGISCLKLGNARVLHMPGELFVEYQLSAAKLAPDRFVAMAAYGDYAPGYIGTEIGYSQGGYETSARASRVAPTVEKVLMGAVERLLAE